MSHYYIVDNGLGKHLMFSSLLESIKIKHDEKVNIISLYPELFKYHPAVKYSVHIEEPGFYDNIILKDENAEIHYSDPYLSNYILGKSHLIDEWAKQLGLKIPSTLRPDIYIDQTTYKNANDFAKTLGKFVLVQFSGGQSVNQEPTVPFKNKGQIRDYPLDLSQELVDNLTKKYPDLTILNFCKENEDSFQLKSDNIKNLYGDISFLFIAALSQFSYGHITIDSSLNHLCSHRYNENVGITLYGSTGNTNIGYLQNYALSNTENNNIRPLTKTVCDRYITKDEEFIPDETSINIPVEKIINTVDEMLIVNNDRHIKKKNIIFDPAQINEINIDNKTKQILMQLLNQEKYLQGKIDLIINSLIKNVNASGKFSLTKEIDKLIKLNG